MIPSTSILRGVLAKVSRKIPTLRTAYTRSFASVLPSVPAKKSPRVSPAEAVNGQLRPQLNIPVNSDHGLYAFFRKSEDGGVVKYETVDAFNLATHSTGRSWTAAELRRKSFRDLHTLWYVLLRERNLLATQREEARRLQININRTEITAKAHRVRKSMARIKYVINERRLAYEGALKILSEKHDALLIAVEPLTVEAPTVKETKKTRKVEKAAELAAAGLFETVEVQSGSSEKHS